MNCRYSTEVTVGAFMLAAILGILFMALQVSGLSSLGASAGYQLKAYFDDIGDLRLRAPVTIAGVKVGQVADISLDAKSYRGLVVIEIKRGVTLPGGTSASIFTQGLLGSNYISLTPGFDDHMPMKAGDVIDETHPAIILENLIGKLIFDNNKDSEETQKQHQGKEKK